MRFFLAFALLLSANVFAAQYPQPDTNGYVSQHDQPVILSTDTCASGRTCHRLPTSCDVVFTPSSSLSSINNALAGGSGNKVFCFGSGTYNAFSGAVTLPANSDCTASSPCWAVAKYNVDRQILTDPWRLSSGNNVILKSDWSCSGAHWIVAYLTWQDWNSSSGQGFLIKSSCDGLVTNSTEVNNSRGTGVFSFYDVFGDDSVIERFYCHDKPMVPNNEQKCVRNRVASGNVVANSEFKNVSIGTGCFGGKGSTDRCDDLVWENNDYYQDSSYTTDCNGGTGDICGGMKGNISDKSGASAGHPMVMVHNRTWHQRRTARNSCCTSTSDGDSFLFSSDTGTDYSSSAYILIRNNIFEDVQRGVDDARTGQTNNSLVGNIFYHIYDYHGDDWSYGIALTEGTTNTEIYLNTFVDVAKSVNITRDTADVRCNVFINTGAAGYVSGSGTQADYNVFYGTPEFATESPDHNYAKGSSASVLKWTASTNYGGNDVVTPTKQPGDSGFNPANHGFIFAVQSVNGPSGNVEPQWCQSLGCTVADGGITWVAIRAPYVYSRRLLSGPEQSTIPYARVDTSAPEVGLCPTRGYADALGSRVGIGVDDQY